MIDHSIADMFYLQLPPGGPTQGDIWSGLPSGSAGQQCAGLIITPRCDFAHAKSPVLNYLPIVSLPYYIETVACFPQIQKLASETRDALKGKAERLGIGHLLEVGVSAKDALIELDFHPVSVGTLPSKQSPQIRSEYEACLSKLTELTDILKCTMLPLDELRKYVNKNKLSAIYRDIIKNNTSDTYFLPPCEDLLSAPSVVLLRHIYTCPIDTVSRTGKAPHVRQARHPAPERLLRLNSPFIESLVSKFAALFTRVGTRDIPNSVVDDLIQIEMEVTQ